MSYSINQSHFSAGLLLIMILEGLLQPDQIFFKMREDGFASVKIALNATVKVVAWSHSGSLKNTNQGSGTIIRPDGLIITSYHIIEGAEKLEVTLFNGITTYAELVAIYPEKDLTVLKINKTGLPFIKLGRSSYLQIGDKVFAVGSPRSLDFSLTSGVVSAFNRRINVIPYPEAIEQFIQTDAPTNRGCSGGPLLNSQGELVGINTAIFSQTGQFDGYSFAQPVEMVWDIMKELRYK